MYNKDEYFIDDYLIGLLAELEQYCLYNAKIIIQVHEDNFEPFKKEMQFRTSYKEM